MADIVVVNKVDTADPDDVRRVIGNVRSVNPSATIVEAASPVSLEGGESLAGKRALVIDDGPTITHGGMPYGAGTVAARQAGVAELVDPRPFAVGSIVETFRKYPHIGAVLPAMGYGAEQLTELEETINATDCDVVITGTPMNLGRLIQVRHPVQHATYVLADHGHPTLAEALEPFIEANRKHLVVTTGMDDYAS
jgi:predicted GTPase